MSDFWFAFWVRNALGAVVGLLIWAVAVLVFQAGLPWWGGVLIGLAIVWGVFVVIVDGDT